MSQLGTQLQRIMAPRTPHERITYDDDTLIPPIFPHDARLARRAPGLAVVEAPQIHREGRVAWTQKVGELEFIARRIVDEQDPVDSLHTPYSIRRQRRTGRGMLTHDTIYPSRAAFECVYHGVLGI